MYEMNGSSARIALVDDHPLFRAGLRDLLSKEPGLEVVVDAGTTSEGYELAMLQRIDLAVVDVVVPPVGGPALVHLLKNLQPACKILGLSFLEDPSRIASMLRAGADGFAVKTQPPQDIVDAVKRVLAGERYLPPFVSRDEVERLAATADVLDRLTHREREVFELLVKGHTNDDISARLFIARRTVEAHRHHLMHKLETRSVVDLVRLAVRHGIAGA